MVKDFHPSSEGTPPACPPHLIKRLLRPPQVSELLEHLTGIPVSIATLAKWRCRPPSCGPLKFRHIAGGKFVAYDFKDVVEFADRWVSGPVGSTSEVRL